MKKVLTILLCLVLVIAIVPSFNVSADTINDLYGTKWLFNTYPTLWYNVNTTMVDYTITNGVYSYNGSSLIIDNYDNFINFWNQSTFPSFHLTNTVLQYSPSPYGSYINTVLPLTVEFTGHCTNINIINFFVNNAIQVVQYNILYNVNGGNLPSGTSNPTIVSDSKLPSVLPTPTKSGYQFKGWYYDSHFQNQAYASDSITGSVTLYALWYEPPINKLTRIGGSLIVMLGGVVTALASNSFSSLLPLFLIGIVISLLFLAYKLIRKVIKK